MERKKLEKTVTRKVKKGKVSQNITRYFTSWVSVKHFLSSVNVQTSATVVSKCEKAKTKIGVWMTFSTGILATDQCMGVVDSTLRTPPSYRENYLPFKWKYNTIFSHIFHSDSPVDQKSKRHVEVVLEVQTWDEMFPSIPGWDEVLAAGWSWTSLTVCLCLLWLREPLSQCPYRKEWDGRRGEGERGEAGVLRVSTA